MAVIWCHMVMVLSRPNHIKPQRLIYYPTDYGHIMGYITKWVSFSCLQGHQAYMLENSVLAVHCSQHHSQLKDTTTFTSTSVQCKHMKTGTNPKTYPQNCMNTMHFLFLLCNAETFAPIKLETTMISKIIPLTRSAKVVTHKHSNLYPLLPFWLMCSVRMSFQKHLRGDKGFKSFSWSWHHLSLS